MHELSTNGSKTRAGIEAAARAGGTTPAPRLPKGGSADERVQALPAAETLSGIGQAVATVVGTAVEARGFARPVIVEDGVKPEPGQIRRSAFLAQARARVCEGASEELSAVGQSSDGCPYIQYWLTRAAAMPAGTLERLIGLYARPAERTPAGLLTALSARVRQGVRDWIGGGRIQDVMPGAVSALAGAAVQLKAREPGLPATSPHAGNPATVRAQLGPGEPLEVGMRTRMEQAFGTSFPQVRLHRDGRAARVAADHGALALTVGQDVVMGEGTWRPGTLGGDLLLAHELAHTIQQRGGQWEGTAAGALEREADGAALAMILGRQTSMRPNGGLRLSACRCGSERTPERSLYQSLQGERDAVAIALRLRGVEAGELTSLADKVGPTGLLHDVVAWEQAFRARDWSRLAAMARGGRHGLEQVYGPEVAQAITTGGLSLSIDAQDRDFHTWMAGQIGTLATLPSGFRLLLELLATGQTVTLSRTTTGESEVLPLPGRGTEEGQMRILGPDGEILPVSQWTRGTAAGSRVLIRRSQLENMVTFGGRGGAPEVIEGDPTAGIAHELIHALDRARGEGIPNPELLQIPAVGTINPVTGGVESINELRTITGARTYQWRGSRTRFPGSHGISENDIRRDLGLAARTAHEAHQGYHQPRISRGTSIAQLAARYRHRNGAPVSAALRAEITTMLRQDFISNDPIPADLTLRLPSGAHVWMLLRARGKSEALTSEAAELVFH